jgi:CubicO group peptidase (beta-lactamase class C family)
MDQATFQSWLETSAGALEVTGVAAGISHEGAEHYAYFGVTSVDHPLEVDDQTLFQYGSTHKTFTATAIMRLVDQGLVGLEEKVRTYVPELQLADESVAEAVTVLQLLNHTAGWSGDAHEDFGEGHDALERFVASMSKLEQVTPLGATVSYNNASLSLAGHLIARVTGKTYEHAMRELVHDPLGLESTFMLPGEVMTRRFAVGHRQTAEGATEVIRPWALPRAGCPAGGYGVTANARDQIAWGHKTPIQHLYGHGPG